MTFATNMTATAHKLLLAYGQSISFDRVVEGAFVPSTGAVGSGTHTTYSAYGAPAATPDNEINGTTTVQGDLNIWLEANASYTPVIGDVASLTGQAFRVLAITPYYAQGSIVLYKLQVRI